MAFILAKKLGMSRVLEGEKPTAATVLEAGPCFISQIKTKTKDGYRAVQIGFDKAKKINKALAGHLKGLEVSKHLREFRVGKKDLKVLKTGDEITVAGFKEGEKVKITAISKGKGFAGGVKRWHFKGGPRTHGQKNRERAPGSIGATHPQHVPKGRHMAGRMGGETVTVKNLRILKIDPTNNLLVLKGAVPGVNGALVQVRSVRK